MRFFIFVLLVGCDREGCNVPDVAVSSYTLQCKAACEPRLVSSVSWNDCKCDTATVAK